MRTLYEAANGIEAHMLVDLLTQEGVNARTEGEYLQGAVGGLPASGNVRVMVDEEQYEAGSDLIKRWNESQPTNASAPGSARPPARWPYLLAGIAIGVAGTYAYVGVPITMSGVDHNGDNTLDEKWTYASTNLLLKAEADRNLDGKTDFITRYDLRGLPAETESDDNFDGVFETRMLYRVSNPQVSTSDTDGDGFEDLRTTYRHGVITTIEHLEPRTGRALKIEHYKLGKITHSEFDTQGSGTVDRRTTYDRIGEVTKTESIAR